MKTIKGIGASAGVADAKLFKLVEEEIAIELNLIEDSMIDKNIDILNNSISLSEKQILKLKENAIKNIGQEKAEVFDAHISILNDPEIFNSTVELIKNNKFHASRALKDVAQNFIDIFSSMEDEYMKERASDIKDVTSRVIKNILNIKIKDLTLIDEEVIIVAHDLTPSETSQLNPKFVMGFITEIGGRTSHSAIMARTLEIPAIVGAGSEIFSIKENSEILMDGNSGEIFVNPSVEKKNEFKAKKKLLEAQIQELKKYINSPTLTKDGIKTEIVANIGMPKDVEGVLKFGGEGVGLFRSEFLYMDSTEWPSEEEQFNAYKEVLIGLKGKKVVIRTLDIGGDKHLSYYDFPKEMNPFLGYRAIRLQLDNRKILKSQVRALLRASAFGILAINVPMIATIDEFKQVKQAFLDEEKALKKEGIAFGKYELGIMVEVPSVVELVDKFAKYADFFSIGTNDLIQYTFAADRMSENVSYLYQPFNPAILRKISKIIEASHEKGKWTAICGEMAGEPKLVPIFVGMGLDEYSMSSTSIPSIRRLISLIDSKKAKELVNKVLDLETSDEVIKEIELFFKENKIQIY